MKTKIIYISGSETFEMSKIRAAFEEVRETLGLDKDTVLFGVPVDADCALAQQPEQDTVAPVIEQTIEAVAEPENIPEVIDTIDTTEPEIQTPTESSITEETITETADEESTVVPILSVLGIQDEPTDTETMTENHEEEEVVVAETFTEPETVEAATEESVQAVIVDIEHEMPADEVMPEKISLDDVADEEAPITETEKTLEQLLESMTPLREDVETHSNEQDSVESETMVDLDTDDTDATLAQLASEFAQNEDKIAPAPKAETTGKIGKLKNILPFKKAKRDDSGLMGDLFGWAGIAANDEDFTIPGFFTQKKQGA